MGGLKDLRGGGRDEVPALREEPRGEAPGLVGGAIGEVPARDGVEHAGVKFALPEHLQSVALRVVIEARERDERLTRRVFGRDNALDEVASRAHGHNRSGLGCGHR